MPSSEAHAKANHKYRAKVYDVMQVQVKKGLRDVYKAQAAAHGLSLNAYIISLLDADRAADAQQLAADAQQLLAADAQQSAKVDAASP